MKATTPMIPRCLPLLFCLIKRHVVAEMTTVQLENLLREHHLEASVAELKLKIQFDRNTH